MIRQAAEEATAHQDPTIIAAAAAAVHASDREAEQQQHHLGYPLHQGVALTATVTEGALDHGMAVTSAVADAATSVAEGALQQGKALKNTVAGGIGHVFDVERGS